VLSSVAETDLEKFRHWSLDSALWHDSDYSSISISGSDMYPDELSQGEGQRLAYIVTMFYTCFYVYIAVTSLPFPQHIVPRKI
jgi:hypothetical protein